MQPEIANWTTRVWNWRGWPASWGIGRWITSALFLAVVLLIYVQRIGFHLPAYRFQINPDGIGYMAVAQHWLNGHWADAVNAYWSPLYSWLMVPLLACGFDPLLTTKLTSAIAGAIALAAAWRLGHHMGIRPELRAAACLAMIPFIVLYTLFVITPDLLVAAMILAYLATSCSMVADPLPAPTDHRRRWLAWINSPFMRCALAGLMAGLCYLAKAYALPVVAGHLLLTGIARTIAARGRRLRATAQVAVGLLVFAAIVGAWSAALTVKFGSFMTGSTGRYNYYLNGPKSNGQPMHRGRLFPPPNPSASTIWEDPTNYMPPAWNPLHSQAEWDHQVKLLNRNWSQLLDILRDMLPAWPIALAAGAMTMLAARRRECRVSALAVVAMTTAYPLGYLLLHVEERFIMLEPLLLILIGVQAIGAVSAGWWWIRWPLQWVAVALILWTPAARPPRPRFPARTPPQQTLAIPPIIQTPGLARDVEVAIEDAVAWMMDRSIVKRIEQRITRPPRESADPKINRPPPINRDEIARTTMALWGKIPPGARVASVEGAWDFGAYICFHLSLRHYGQTPPPSRGNDVEQQWIDHGIEYVFWNTPAPRLRLLNLDPVIPGVWRITPRPPASRPSTTRATTQP